MATPFSVILVILNLPLVKKLGVNHLSSVAQKIEVSSRQSKLMFQKMRYPTSNNREKPSARSLIRSSPRPVPELQSLPPPDRLRPRPGQPDPEPEEVEGGVRPQLAARGGHRFPEDDEPAQLFQPPGERHLLRGVQGLVEPARGEVGAAGAEQEAAPGQPDYGGEHPEHPLQHHGVRRQPAVDVYATPPADG